MLTRLRGDIGVGQSDIMEHAVVECEERASLAVALDPRLGRDKSPEQARAHPGVLDVAEVFYGR